jgi:hypothetical protein
MPVFFSPTIGAAVAGDDSTSETNAGANVFYFLIAQRFRSGDAFRSCSLRHDAAAAAFAVAQALDDGLDLTLLVKSL